MGVTFGFITQSKLLGGSTPQTPRWGRVDSFKLSTANFESINLTEDSQVYLFLIKIVSHNN
ncbi:Mobile element protein [Microcystis panniformis FACHB-1757]|uniref:Mobile element protein n=1 Tax=Microcystis panniformis FACHB-1757 TaxID=1638788 RepID=A0A0K1S9H3_9CHRO|nr:Mobile element protein [Microcystis panniformis FACHB-1757]